MAGIRHIVPVTVMESHIKWNETRRGPVTPYGLFKLHMSGVKWTRMWRRQARDHALHPNHWHHFIEIRWRIDCQNEQHNFEWRIIVHIFHRGRIAFTTFIFFKPRTSDLKLRITHSASGDDRHCDARIVQSPAYRVWTRFWQALSCIVATHPSRHYTDVIMSLMASQITSLAIVYSPVCSGTDQRKHQSSASLAFVRGIHWDRWIPRTKGQ